MSTEVTETQDAAAPDRPRESTRGVPVFRPLADIRDSGQGAVLTLDMPGVGPDGVEIELERRVLTIRGRGRLTAPEGYRLAFAEYREGDYERVFTLSETIDEAAIRAEMAGGVLTLTLPRAEAARPKRIEVKAG
jgi:HSP20 family molecular chaperone IbpA